MRLSVLQRCPGSSTWVVLELYLFRVVDLPDDGLPTSPISGSRPMIYNFLLCSAETDESLIMLGKRVY